MIRAGVFILLLALVLFTHAMAAENPDELYNQGRFAEAEKAYADSDMDHPKDIRYRYNRGCAAYQNSDYKGAMAAFTSVLRRAQDNETRFKTLYNLGNTAFKKADYASAVAHYKEAILYNPQSEEAKYNLELAMRELEKLKKDKNQGPNKSPQEDPARPQEKGGQPKTDRQGEGREKASHAKGTDQRSSQAKDQKGKDKGQSESGQELKPQQTDSTTTAKGEKVKQDSPKNLSGKLMPMQGLPEQGEDNQTSAPAMSIVDKKKAEALLDNIKEDRSKFLRFQVPDNKEHGVLSGKDW